MAQGMRRANRLAIAIGFAALLLVGSAGCGDDGGDNLPTPSTPRNPPAAASPTPTLDAREAEAWDEIQTRFDAFMETWIKWAAEGSPGGLDNPALAELGQYVGTFFRDQVGAELIEETRSGQVRTGRPQWRDARVLHFDWDRTVQDLVVPEVVFEVCVDDSAWVIVDAETGEPVAPAEPGGPHVWTVTSWWVEERDFGPDGWALSDREVDRSRSC